MLLFLILILITFFLLCQTLDVNLKNWIRRPELLSNDNYQDVVDYLVERNYSSDIPRYGFFSSIIESLVKIRKTYGVDIKKALRELRKAILKDYKQKRKLRSELFGLYLQYMMLLIFTWGFLFQLLGTIKINVTSSQILLLIFWQLLGFFLGGFLFFLSKRVLFRGVEEIFYTTYCIRSMVLASRPLGEILSLSNFDDILVHKHFESMKARTNLLISQIKVQGSVSLDEFSNIIEELWDFYEEQLIRLKRIMNAVKLIMMLAFIFPCFLYCIYLALSGMAI